MKTVKYMGVRKTHACFFIAFKQPDCRSYADNDKEEKQRNAYI